MRTLQGFSDDAEVPRILDVESHGSEILLWTHPPGNRQSGQDILVPRAALAEAVRSGAGQVAGVSPVRRSPKICEVERRPEGLRVMIYPRSGKGAWWVLVAVAELEAAIE